MQRSVGLFDRHRGRPWARRGMVILWIVCFLATLVGAPLPVRIEKDRTRPFPCQDRSCLCSSADDCDQHCCCFSREEQREWHRALQRPSTSRDTHRRDRESHDRSCPACEVSLKTSRGEGPALSDSSRSPTGDHGPVPLISVQARRCQGDDSGVWMSMRAPVTVDGAGVVLASTERDVWRSTAWLMPVCLALDPPEPVPRSL